MLKKVTLYIALPLIVTWWLAWPVYEFYAFRGKIDFLPYHQFDEIPEEIPSEQQIFNQYFAQGANQSFELLKTHKKSLNAPSISAAVAINNQLIWAGSVGWADVKNKIAATTKTQYRIGSTSKALTNTALARMVDQGEIALDVPISRYIKTLPNSQWANITSRQLASHTAGLVHYKENSDLRGLYQSIALTTHFDDVSKALSVFDGSHLLFKPGTNFSYSSYGTVLLSAVMQQVSKTNYQTLMKNLVFIPANMKHTMTEQEAKQQTPQTLAQFYWNNNGKNTKLLQWRDIDLSHRLAGGGYISTPSDLVKMGTKVLDEHFIRPQTRASFWQPQQLPNGDTLPLNYALGWRIFTHKFNNEIGSVRYANHGGVSRGAQSWLMVIPEYKMAIAININANSNPFWDFAKIALPIAERFILSMPKKPLQQQP